jgi:hypothetical protein
MANKPAKPKKATPSGKKKATPSGKKKVPPKGKKQADVVDPFPGNPFELPKK